MSQQVKTKQSGFTIIEVVLVLAVAALIFLMVFIALPALQRGQRDGARKNDASVVAAAITSYKSNNRGSLPTSGTFSDFKEEYLSDPLSQYENSQIEIANDSQRTSDPGDRMFVYLGDKCSDESSNAIDGNSRTAAIRVSLETGGTYCQDS